MSPALVGAAAAFTQRPTGTQTLRELHDQLLCNRAGFRKNFVADPQQAAQWSANNVRRMRLGRPPQRYNASKGGIESMELSHEPIPARNGGTNLVPRWPQDHARLTHIGMSITRMMMMMLSDLFMESKGAPVELHGKEVHAIYKFDNVSAGQPIRVEFLGVTPDRPQCLQVEALGGTMMVNKVKGGDFSLWSDSSPRVVHINLNPTPNKRMTIKFWNGWRDTMGITQAWIGNAGMSIRKESEKVLVIGCSDGFNGPTFDDLVIKLSIVDA